MSNRIIDHLSESDREFLRALETTSPGTISKVAPGASQHKPPEPLRPGWVHRDAKQLKCELERLLSYCNNGGR